MEGKLEVKRCYESQRGGNNRGETDIFTSSCFWNDKIAVEAGHVGMSKTSTWSQFANYYLLSLTNNYV